MRFVLGIVVAGLVLWTGLWFLASHRIEGGMEDFMAARQAEGLVSDPGRIRLGGYPYRFDLSLTDTEFAAPDGGLTWRMPSLDVAALAYRPNHLIATLDGEQVIRRGEETIRVDSARLQASLRTRLAAGLPLDRLTAEAEALVLASDAGWGLAVREALAASRRSTEPGAGLFAHDISLAVEGIVPDAALRARIDPAGRLPPEIDSLRLNALVGLDREIDRALFAPDAPLPEIRGIVLRDAGLVWGEADLRLSGALDFDAAGLAHGDLRLTLTGWQSLLDLALSLGIVPEGQARNVERALRLLEMTALGARSIDVTMPVRSGTMMLGPLPVGTLPRASRLP